MGKFDKAVDWIIVVKEEYATELKFGGRLAGHLFGPHLRRKVKEHLEANGISFTELTNSFLHHIRPGHASFHVDEDGNHNHFRH